MTIDNKLNFDEHYMNTMKRRTIMTAFISSQFGYCPLVWMFHSRTLNNRINRIHERALRIVYSDNQSSFDELLNRDNSCTIHMRNIQALAIELYKVINGLSPEIMNQVFQLKEANMHCSRFPFKTRNVKTVSYGTETMSFLWPKMWALVPNEMKNIQSLPEFKSKIKQWKPKKCPCRICKMYITGVGFVEINDA